ncbi:prepilin-type cleavage/methylation domain-containing protein [Colwellia sp. 75C3]|uniref:PilW family protein n=1 Tax=Colwellia sp. 75C3 TaxID=888425 RepID=UPI000C32556C|nr:type II secretion system protein [Colwellia sp. 75C3]PKG85261.1 prepilin-type cleavage/methylation domain-containing protein [Colwellia sp. 75C3]
MSIFKNKPIITGSEFSKGFTLLELILVIMILGIMAVGISGFITLSTQTYLNATNRDGLVSNARFVIERLNRELRNAVPNSIRIGTNSTNTIQCIEFVPIVASTVYIDIPVSPEPASKIVKAIEFQNESNQPYECDGCQDLLMVYPLNPNDIYEDHNDSVGKVFSIDEVDDTKDPWEISIRNNNEVMFSENSPTNRLYIANKQIKYCAFINKIYRYSNSIGGNLTVPGRSRPVLMAEHMIDVTSGELPFTYLPGTLTRNAVVQIHLNFTRNDENYVFDHEVHINNVP